MHALLLSLLGLLLVATTPARVDAQGRPRATVTPFVEESAVQPARPHASP